MTEPSEGSTVTYRPPSDANNCEPIGEKSIVPDFAALPVPSIVGLKMFPMMHPVLIPNFGTIENQEHSNRGAGLYAVPVLPFGGSVTGQIPNTLIPLTYSVPTASSSESEANGQENEPMGHQGALLVQQGGADRIRQFQIAINFDLSLLLKLMVVIYLFHQDGSKQRLALLVFLAAIVYLYQTGALAPLTRWLSRLLNRVPQPARPPRDAFPPDDLNLGNENAVLAGRRQEGEGGDEAENDNDNQAVAVGEGGNVQVENNEQGEERAVRRHNVNPLLALMKEIQIFVVGFITSLLPGFQHLD